MNKLIELCSDEKTWLTQKELDDEKNRFFGKAITCNQDKKNDYILVNDEYKLKWEEEYLNHLIYNPKSDLIENT